MGFYFGLEHCRVCFLKPKKSRCINESEEDGEETPIEMMQKLIGAEMTTNAENFEIPQRICKSCFLSLDLAFQFRSKLLKAEHIINSYIKKENSEVKDENQDIRLHIESSDESDLEFIEEIQNDVPMTNYDKQTINYDFDKQTTVEENTQNVNEEYLEDCDELEFMIDYDDQDDSNVFEEVFIFDKNEIYNDTQITAQTTSKIKEKIDKTTSQDLNQTQTKLKKKEKQEDKSSEENKRNSENKMSHICDICGNGFDKRARMMEHRRRHTKELIFACEICDERFHLRENMRRHMLTHRGDRPYKCSYCSRTFYYESVKKTHELVHNGVKPYVCKVCSKPFAYAHALKKHMMIHDEVKLFNCKYCQKEFRLQHHLKQHEETKTHQHAVENALQTKGRGRRSLQYLKK